MEQTVIDFLFSTLASLAAQYPDTKWIAVALGVLMTVCGLCSVASIWIPAPKETTGLYAAMYRWVHALALHSGQNKGPLADGKSDTVIDEVTAVTGE